MKKIIGALIVIVLVGMGIYFYQSRTYTANPAFSKGLNDKSAKPQAKKYINNTFGYEFTYLEPPFSAFACASSAQGTKLQKSDGTEDLVIVYNTYATSTPILPACAQSDEWYKIDGYEASVLAIKESESAWKQRLTEFQKPSATTMQYLEFGSPETKYEKITKIGEHTALLRGENVQIAETDTQIISRNNNITYSIKFNTGSRTSVAILLDSLKFSK